MPEKDSIIIRGLKQNNLKNVSLDIPKGKIVVFTGVSGSGKSSIVFDTIAAESQRQMNETYTAFMRGRLPKYEKPKVERIDNLSASVIVDQSRLGGQRPVHGGNHQRHVRRAAAALFPHRGTLCGHRLVFFLQRSQRYVPGVLRHRQGDDGGH